MTRQIIVLTAKGMLCLCVLAAGCTDSPTYIDVRDPTYTDPLAYVMDSNQSYRRPPCSMESYIPPLNLAAVPSSALAKSPALHKLQADLASFVTVNPLEASVSASGPNTYHMDIEFSIAGIDLCQYHGRLHAPAQGPAFVKGRLPYDLSKAPDLTALTWTETHEKWVRSAARQLGRQADSLALYRSKRCLLSNQTNYRAAWQLDFFVDEAPYRAVVVDGELGEVIPQFFKLTANTVVYDHNILSGKLVTVELQHMQAGGYLCSDYLTTRVPRYRDLAYNPDLVFSYPVDDNRFLEVSAFTSVSQMWDWFLAKRPTNWSRIPVELVVTNHPNHEERGPIYLNPEISNLRDRPTIYVPDVLRNRNGVILKNLSTDSEALAHELGHHILFQYVGMPEKNAEHAALHEAIADFFVFAKTGDPCLAESICAANASLCNADKTCLRSALNDLTYTSNSYKQLYGPHSKSELITGFLWDLFKVDQIPLAHVGDLVFAAMPYMDRITSFSDFLQALLKAEETTDANQHQCTIIQRAIARGFAELLAPHSCP